MTRNWQQADWPKFTWEVARFIEVERAFLIGGGVTFGKIEHLDRCDVDTLITAAVTTEALKTSEIEGELLDRESVQSSIRRELGLATDSRRARPAEEGIAELMVGLYQRAADPLDHDTLFQWQQQIVRGRQDLADVGRYRTHPEPMRIVSGDVDNPTIHFEAPPSTRVLAEMEAFLEWFGETSPGGPQPLGAVTRAGLAHLYFVSIHPFEDGNGRIARAISEKALAQGLGKATLTALAATILVHRREYYDQLERATKSNNVTQWLAWFAGITLEAQRRTQMHVEFVLEKALLLNRLQDQLNERQQRALLRMLREGPDGFQGGLSAGNYSSITGAPSATATRDLVRLVDLGALTRTGERRGTRYHLSISTKQIPRITIGARGEIGLER